jgi:LPS-assembly lipoprotein
MGWMSKLALVVVVASLTGCGFKPLYGVSSGTDPSAALAGVSIPEPKARFTQLIRTNLLSSMGQDGGGIYRLELSQTVSDSAVIRSKPGLNQRELLQVSVSYRLLETKTGKLLTHGSTFANVPFDRVNSEFANVQAQSNATQRAANQVADDIRTRVAVYFAGGPAQP